MAGNNVCMPRLRRVSCAAPGLSRRRHGRGFRYLEPSGRPVSDPDTLARAKALAIPPAWTDAWICPDPRGHLQAVGFDAKGRRQYLYHEQWRLRRDRQKFDRMVEFGAILPKVRHRYREALALEGLVDERVVGCGVALIDMGLFRVGSPAYTRDNGTFGLCTVERRHVRVAQDKAQFDFPAKSGRRWVVEVEDPDVVAAVSALKSRRGGGSRLLVARSTTGWQPVSPADVNSFIKGGELSDFSAKEFRTWHATVLAATTLAELPGPSTTREMKAAVRDAINNVADSLGNTPAVARRSYIDPRVIDRFTEGRTIGPLLTGLGRDANLADPTIRDTVEQAVLDLLADR